MQACPRAPPTSAETTYHRLSLLPEAWKLRLRLANGLSMGTATSGRERKGGRAPERRGCLGDAGGALGVGKSAEAAQ